MTQEVLKLALEALKRATNYDPVIARAITAIKEALAQEQECWCTTCRPITMADMRFVVCPDCGNKRCPKANDHRNACTNSNEVGQKGSSWEHVKPLAQPEQEPVAWLSTDSIGERHLCFDKPLDNDPVQPLYTAPPQPEQEPFFTEANGFPQEFVSKDRQKQAIISMTEQCAALVWERDELQKQVWLYEKNGVTCQTYRHKVEQSCSECNVQMNYTTPPQRTWVGLTEEEKSELWEISRAAWPRYITYASLAEAKLKEKNT
jgi:hypothetical protein